jgi:hypothetical protein
MDIHLSPELEAQVRTDAAAAGFEDVESYIQAVLWSSPALNDWVPDDIKAFKVQLEQAWQESERGDLTSPEDFQEEMRAMKAEFHVNNPAA